MPSNPFRRKRDPLDQALAVFNDVRSEAAKAAGELRDVASKAADLLGGAADNVPEGASKRLPLIGAAVAGVAAVAVAIRAKSRKSSAPPPAPTPVPTASPTAVKTAAKATMAPPPAPSSSGLGEEKEEPAEAATPETLSDPKVDTDESKAAED